MLISQRNEEFMSDSSRRMSLLSLLSILQQIASFAVVFLSLISSPRFVLLTVGSQPNIPGEFLALTVALADIPAVILVVLGCIRLVAEPAYRTRFTKLFEQINWRLGGFIWILLILWVALSTRWSISVAMASFSGAHIALALATAIFLASLIDSEIVLRRVLWMLVTSLLFQAVIGILQVITQGPLGLAAFGEMGRFSWDLVDFFRARGLSEHPNYYGGCLALGLFACFILLQPPKQIRRTVPPAVIVVFMAILLAGMTGSLSRSAFVGTFFGALPLVAWAVRNIPRRWLILTSAGISLLVLIVGAIALRGDPQNATTRLFGAREFFFDYSLAVIKQAPLIGVGSGNLMVRVSINEFGNQLPLLPVHNVYLYLWAELGIPGLLLYLVACGLIFWRSELWQIGQITTLRIWGCAILAICVIILFDNYFWAVDPHRMTFFWVIGVWWAIYTWTESLKSASSPAISTEDTALDLITNKTC
jgi:O-antigen ligase